MTALSEFNDGDWRGNCAAAPARPLNWNKSGWQTPQYFLAGIYRSIFAAVVYKVAAASASFRSARANASPLSIAAMIYTTVLWAPLIDLNSATRLMPEHVAQGLEVVAALWVIAARRTLSRVTVKQAALCRVADTGAYKFVRHPIYAGRAVLCGAFLMSNFNVQNGLILLSVYVAQIYRIVIEENHLMKDVAYQRYAQKVRYRLIYGVF